MDLWTVREGEKGTNGEWRQHIRTLSGIRWIAAEKLPWSTGSPVWLAVMTWRDGGVGEEGCGGRGCMCNYG